MRRYIFLILILGMVFAISSFNTNAQTCSNDAFQCGSNGQEKCVNNVWKVWNTCSYGCNGGYCNSGPGQVYGLDPNYVPPVADPCAGQCSLGSFQCGSSGNQEKCVSGGSCNVWTIWNTCFNGCNNNACNPAPVQPSCNNECSSGSKQCSEDGSVANFRIQECGNFDDDSCLEWGLTNRYCDEVSKDLECQQICGSTAPVVVAPDVVVTPDVIVKQPESINKTPASVQDVKVPDRQAITKESIQAPAQKINVDFNNNGCSDFSDFLEFGNNFGSSSSKYDFNKNGEVDFSDFVEFAKTYEQTQCDTSTIVQAQVENEIDCNADPLKCYNIQRKNNKCENLKLGEKCEVSWEIEIDDKSLLNSQVGMNVMFNYETKNKEKKESRVSTALRILGEITGERRFALTSNSVLDITGNVINPLSLGVNKVGRFECVLKTGNGACCHAPFFVASQQNPNICVRAPFRTESAIALTNKESVLNEISDRMQRFLNSQDSDEKEVLEKELRELDSRLRE